jgi:hypothetical protein
MDDETTSSDMPDDAPGDAPHLTVIDGGVATAGTDQAKPKGAGKRRKLTSKQERFLAALIRNEGGSLSDCYREAYDTSRMSNAAIHNEASLLAGHREVARRLALHQASIERSAASSALSRRAFVLEGLQREASEADSDSARVAALIALGKTSGVDLFTDRVEQVADRSPDEVRAELEDRLAALLGRTG